jgi:hypothetical protein
VGRLCSIATLGAVLHSAKVQWAPGHQVLLLACTGISNGVQISCALQRSGHFRVGQAATTSAAVKEAMSLPLQLALFCVSFM